MRTNLGDEQEPRSRRRRPGPSVDPKDAEPSSSDASADESSAEPPLSDLLKDAGRRLADHAAALRADISIYLKARKDRLGLKTKSVAFQIASLAVVGVFGVVALATAGWLFLHGLAGAIAALFDWPFWAGSILVGLGLPLFALAMLFWMKRRGERRQLEELQREYRELELLRRRAHDERAARRAAAEAAPAPPPEERAP